MPPRIPYQAASRLGATAKRGRINTPAPSSRCALVLLPPTTQRPYATASSSSLSAALKLPDDYIPPTKPPSARRPEARKSQLLRSYTSLLRSTPLMLIFQHNNITPSEWSAVRRELRFALSSLPPPPPGTPDIAPSVLIQVVRTAMLKQALKIVEFYDPAAAAAAGATYTHDLSQAAFDAVLAAAGREHPPPADSTYAQMAPLLTGPVALVSFPAVSPAHLAAVLSVLAPSAPAFPAPTRRKRPGYHELTTQSGLRKLLLVGGRVDGSVFDVDGVKWVGGIEGGLDGLRGQLVTMLQSAGMGLVGALEGAGKSLYWTMEGRKTMLEEAEKPEAAEKAEGKKKE